MKQLAYILTILFIIACIIYLGTLIYGFLTILDKFNLS